MAIGLEWLKTERRWRLLAPSARHHPPPPPETPAAETAGLEFAALVVAAVAAYVVEPTEFVDAAAPWWRPGAILAAMSK